MITSFLNEFITQLQKDGFQFGKFFKWNFNRKLAVIIWFWKMVIDAKIHHILCFVRNTGDILIISFL